jgi:ATP-binding cassette subfamily F protein uup
MPAAPQRTTNAAEQRAARKEAARLERRMTTLTTKEAKLHEQLAAAATDPARLMELNAQLKDVVTEREAVELEWLEAAEAAEQ